MLPDEIVPWIRANIPKSKLKIAKKFLSHYDGFLDMDGLSPRLIERCYRGVKNSYKVERAYNESLEFLRYLVFLLKPEKKTLKEVDLNNDLINTTFIKTFYNEVKSAKEKDIEKKESRASLLGAY